jgi:hypothetical protein
MADNQNWAAPHKRRTGRRDNDFTRALFGF